MTLPALFIAHGAPDLPLSTTPARAFTEGLGQRLPGVEGHSRHFRPLGGPRADHRHRCRTRDHP